MFTVHRFDMLGSIAAFLVLLTVICAVAGVLFFRRRFRYWKNLHVPFIRPTFFFGNIGGMCFSTSPGEGIKNLYDKSKGHRYLGCWFWWTPTLIIRDLDLVKNVLVKDFTFFHDRVKFADTNKDPVSGHLFTLKGPRWRNLRPKLSPAFSTGKMKNYFSKFVEFSEELVNLVIFEMENHENVVDVREVTARYTTDATCLYALGVEAGCMKNEDAVFRKMGKMIFSPTVYNCFRTLAPLLLSTVAKFLGLKLTHTKVSKFFLEDVRNIVELRANSEGGSDFMQLLIDLKKGGKIEKADRVANSSVLDDNWHFSTADAIAQTHIFFLAGTESSSLIMQYALYEMSLNQSIQNRLREEVTSVIAQYGGRITYEGLNEMKYLNQVIDETLRKYPIVPIAFRTCTEDYQVPESNLLIPKGMQVQISIYGIHMDPEIYPDPEVFDPERFSESQKNARHRYAYLPFGEGPRICLGMRFSLFQKKVGLAALISNFKFEVCQHTTIPLTFNTKAFFFTPAIGKMPLRVERLT